MNNRCDLPRLCTLKTKTVKYFIYIIHLVNSDSMSYLVRFLLVLILN